MTKCRKTKWINKNCDWCLESWYDGRNYVTKTCDFHQKYSYQRDLDELKQDRKDLIKWRIGSLLFTTLFILEASLGMFLISESLILSGLLFAAQGFTFLCFGFWMLFENEKTNGKYIQEDLNKLKNWKEVNDD